MDWIEPAARFALAQHDPSRFLWAADVDAALTDDDDGALAAVLAPATPGAELQVALKWFRDERFLDHEAACQALEARLDAAEEGAGWFALADVLRTLARRGSRHRAARRLEELMARYWLDGSEGTAIEEAASAFPTARLVLAMRRHEPWRSRPERLEALVGGCETEDLTDALLGRLDAGKDIPGLMLLWRALALREEADARDATASVLAHALGQPLGRVGALDIVLALQRVHGDAALRGLVAVFLTGAHRHPEGEVIEHWLSGRAAGAMEAALDDLPEWLPRFEPTSMDRLCWRLMPKLSADERETIRDLAEVVGGPRATLVVDELDALAG
ncbi:MAG: hypothetical protein GY898_04220 [Proteobacteria bacterium]|nr:hypothetical protein [Pseudomonadota bacterium]